MLQQSIRTSRRLLLLLKSSGRLGKPKAHGAHGVKNFFPTLEQSFLFIRYYCKDDVKYFKVIFFGHILIKGDVDAEVMSILQTELLFFFGNISLNKNAQRWSFV